MDSAPWWAWRRMPEPWAVTRINLTSLCSPAVAHLQASSHPNSSSPRLSSRSLSIKLPGSPPLLNVTFYLPGFFISLENASSAVDHKPHGNRKRVPAMFVIPQRPADMGHCIHTRRWARQREEEVKGEREPEKEEANGRWEHKYSHKRKPSGEGERTDSRAGVYGSVSPSTVAASRQ